LFIGLLRPLSEKGGFSFVKKRLFLCSFDKEPNHFFLYGQKEVKKPPGDTILPQVSSVKGYNS